MPGGTIKRLVRDRGFGFIRDDGGQEWFFHRSSVQGSFDQLNEGQRVSFDEEPSAKGPAGRQRAQRRLILFFDIDGTLVLTGGAGGRAARERLPRPVRHRRLQRRVDGRPHRPVDPDGAGRAPWHRDRRPDAATPSRLVPDPSQTRDSRARARERASCQASAGCSTPSSHATTSAWHCSPATSKPVRASSSNTSISGTTSACGAFGDDTLGSQRPSSRRR